MDNFDGIEEDWLRRIRLARELIDAVTWLGLAAADIREAVVQEESGSADRLLALASLYVEGAVLRMQKIAAEMPED